MLNNVITSRNNNSDYHIAHRNACFTWNFKQKNEYMPQKGVLFVNIKLMEKSKGKNINLLVSY